MKSLKTIAVLLAIAIAAPCTMQAATKAKKSKANAATVVREKHFPLYADGQIPNMKPGIDAADKLRAEDSLYFRVAIPKLSIFSPAPEKNKHVAIVVCPGGGYGAVCYGPEGREVALRLIEQGITAIVVTYRLPDGWMEVNPSIVPLQDAQTAMLYARTHATELNVDPNKIGVMGFSAGGHLASTVGTHYQKPVIDVPEGMSVRPDFMCLVYPVISLEPEYRHPGTATRLVGDDLPEAGVQKYSNYKHVTADTPPTFLTQASDDALVTVQNSLLFYNAMLANKRPVAMHIFSVGEHGFLKRADRYDFLDYLYDFMRDIKML